MPRVLIPVLVLILAQHATAAQPKTTKPAPVAKILIVQPQAEQQLSGTTDLRTTFEVPKGAATPIIVYSGLGGAPWTQLKRSDVEWAAQIDIIPVPNGSQKLLVLTDNKQASTSVAVANGNGLGDIANNWSGFP